MKIRYLVATAVLGVATLAFAGCASSNPLGSGPAASGGNATSNTVVIGSFNYPESQVLAEIYSQALQGEGVKVQEKFNIGAREITMPALKDGSIDLIPEYSGSVLT